MKSSTGADGDIYEFNVYRFKFHNSRFEPTKISEKFYFENSGFMIEFIISDKWQVNDFYINTLTMSALTGSSIVLSSKNNI